MLSLSRYEMATSKQLVELDAEAGHGATRPPNPKVFTQKQRHYLAFIYTYARMFRRPPAETDMQRHFRVSAPSLRVRSDGRLWGN
jgi:hypothetical protein